MDVKGLDDRKKSSSTGFSVYRPSRFLFKTEVLLFKNSYIA